MFLEVTIDYKYQVIHLYTRLYHLLTQITNLILEYNHSITNPIGKPQYWYFPHDNTCVHNLWLH